MAEFDLSKRLAMPDGPMPELDTGTPHSARMYDYLLGGKDHFAVDRAAAEAAQRVLPTIRTAARENRGYMGRLVRHLTERGIRQFLDIGTGIPTSPSVHQVAQAAAPDTRVVYVDNDPMVLAHARALLTSTPAGRTHYIDADLREPEDITEQASRVLDFDEPVAVLLVAMLHFVPDDWNPHDLLDRLAAPLCPGTYIAASHATADDSDDGSVERAIEIYRRSGIAMQARSAEEFEELLLDGARDASLLAPGVVPVQDWRPTADVRPQLSETSCYAAVVRLS